MKPRREVWGRYVTPEGVVTMIRGSRNRTWFERADGTRVDGIEEANVAPAHCHAVSLGWQPVR